MKNIIFDIDGTLTDTKEVDDKCYIKAVYRTFGIDIRDIDWTKVPHVTDTGIMDHIFLQKKGRKCQPDELDLMKKNLLTLLHEEKKKNRHLFKQVSGSKAFMEEIKQRNNIKVGIATGAWHASAKLKLNSIGLNINGYPHATSDDHITREDIMLNVINKMEVEEDEVIYFGDGLWDLHACRNLGIKFIGVDAYENGKLKKAGAKHVITNYHDRDKVIDLIK